MTITGTKIDPWCLVGATDGPLGEYDRKVKTKAATHIDNGPRLRFRWRVLVSCVTVCMTLHHLCCTPYQRSFVVWLVSLIVSLCQPLSCQRTSAIRHALHRLTMSQPRLSSATIVCSASRVGIAATTYDCLLHPAKACSSAISTIYQCERLCSHCTQRCSTLPGGLALTVCVIS